MGYPPPPDLPPVAQQQQVKLGVGFQGVPVGALPCGLSIPGFGYNISFRIPAFPPFDFPPDLSFFLQIVCSLKDPFRGGIKFGGGRESNAEPDVDEEYG